MAINESTERGKDAMGPDASFGAENEPLEKNVDGPERSTFAPENKELPRTITGWKVSMLFDGSFGVPRRFSDIYSKTVGHGLCLPHVHRPALCPGQHHRELPGPNFAHTSILTDLYEGCNYSTHYS